MQCGLQHVGLMGMTRKYNNCTQQTNQRHREEEILNINVKDNSTTFTVNPYYFIITPFDAFEISCI